MNRFDLFDAMVNGRFIVLTKQNSQKIYSGKILSIQMEDGSGYSFNLVMSNDFNKSFKVYYRCPK